MMENGKGFTLIELLIVIAIIGILAGIIFVRLSSAKYKASRSSAISSAKTALSELEICYNDGGEATSNVPSTGTPICCDDDGAVCSDPLSGHDQNWPNITDTGWTYQAPTAGTSLQDEDYHFELLAPAGETDIVCDFGSKNCQ